MESHPEYEYQPTFQKLINVFDEEDWNRILSGAPHLATPERLKLLADDNLLIELLERHPELTLRGGAELIDGYDWLSLLSRYSELASFCNWDAFYALEGHTIAFALEESTALRNKIDWGRCSKKSVADWVCVLQNAPELAEQCSCFDRFALADWVKLLLTQPQLSAYLDR